MLILFITIHLSAIAYLAYLALDADSEIDHLLDQNYQLSNLLEEETAQKEKLLEKNNLLWMRNAALKLHIPKARKRDARGRYTKETHDEQQISQL